MNRKENGSAMLMVLMLMGSTIGMSYYFMSQGQGQQKIQRGQVINQAVNSLAREVKTALADKNICTLNLQGLGVGSEPTVLNDLTGSKIIEKNQIYKTHAGDVKVESLKIVEDNSSGSVEKVLAVIYDVDPTNSGRAPGARYKGKKFILKGRLNSSSKYIFCYHDETTLVSKIAEENCDSYYGNYTDWGCTPNLDSPANPKVDKTAISCPSHKLSIKYEGYQIKLKCNYF